MRKIFAVEDDIRIVAQVESAANALTVVGRYEADLILFACGLSDSPRETVSGLLAVAPALKIVLVMIEPTEEETVELLRRGVRGIVTRSIAPDLLIKCIRKVHAGETWLDSQGMNWVIEAYRAQAAQLTSPRNRVRLSMKELQVIAGVTQGLRNKDIAQDVWNHGAGGEKLSAQNLRQTGCLRPAGTCAVLHAPSAAGKLFQA